MPSSKKKNLSKGRIAKKVSLKAKIHPQPKKGPPSRPVIPVRDPRAPAPRQPESRGAAAEPVRDEKAPAKPPAKKPSRRGGSSRRGTLDPAQIGEILLPGGPQLPEEIQYLFRGIVAAEHPSADTALTEVQVKRPTGADPESERTELRRLIDTMDKRFETSIEPLLPPRSASAPRRTFQTVQDRARARRREIGAFLRGLDMGQTEPSHLDAHGEDSLETLMKWAARLEKLIEADEPDQADYSQYHRFLDQLENTTETLIVDVEATLRRLRDRVQARN